MWTLHKDCIHHASPKSNIQFLGTGTIPVSPLAPQCREEILKTVLTEPVCQDRFHTMVHKKICPELLQRFDLHQPLSFSLLRVLETILFFHGTTLYTGVVNTSGIHTCYVGSLLAGCCCSGIRSFVLGSLDDVTDGSGFGTLKMNGTADHISFFFSLTFIKCESSKWSLHRK